MPASADRGFWMRLRRLFDEAKDLPPLELAAFLNANCFEQPELQRKLESLIEAHHRAPSLLDQPLPARFLSLSNPPPPVRIEDLTGLVLCKRYMVTSILDQGGSSVVYLARDWQLHGRPVVVKQIVLPREHAGKASELLDAEVSALSVITHPGVAVPLDSGLTPAGAPFLVLQFVPGPTLRAILANGALAPRRACLLLAQIADALEEVHKRSILHLDLKPENILISNAGQPSEQAVIVDFGIARFRGLNEPRDASVVGGSFAYMAPEILTGDPSPASDQYALALIAQEMLTGVKPAPPGAAPDAISGDAAHRPLKAGIRKVISRALNPAPALRYRTASEMVRHLQNECRRAHTASAAWVHWACVVLLFAIALGGGVAVVRDSRNAQARAAEVEALRGSVTGMANLLARHKVADDDAEPALRSNLDRLRQLRESGAIDPAALLPVAELLCEHGIRLGMPGYRHSGNLLLSERMLREARAFVRQALRQDGASIPSRILAAKAADAHASVLLELGHYGEVPAIVEEALPLTLNYLGPGAEERALYNARAALQMTLSRMHFEMDDVDQSLRLRNESVAIRRLTWEMRSDSPEDRAGLARALAARAAALREMGQLAESLCDYDESSSLILSGPQPENETDNQWLVARNLMGTGRTLLASGDVKRARTRLEFSARMFRGLLSKDENNSATLRELALALSWLAMARRQAALPQTEVNEAAREAWTLAVSASHDAPIGSHLRNEIELIRHNIASAGYSLPMPNVALAR